MGARVVIKKGVSLDNHFPEHNQELILVLVEIQVLVGTIVMVVTMVTLGMVEIQVMAVILALVELITPLPLPTDHTFLINLLTLILRM